ncbi:prostaglandin reductase 1-like [Acanthaster planci]|uniref:Prostaglandin reductase 1 n=1 Tax=Acanthaster planci TaxID=133434 RepID=A0A8B7XRB0_ACAPL|nr:prostaglandin reductase 1-like [Acanthaster planci]XP_022082527.1 prostaglandin reductase 1-like [Acanthaster planci]XP_022082528.1 prostaglandin reductase 1-like [Acanthaster planci]XP_022082529.1 prostaglandin reductase 1-like [Acanthaster planci]
MGKGKKWILEKHFQGMPKRSDMKIVEFDLPTVPDGSFLVEAICLSVDPYMRPYSARLPEGITMIGTQVAKVIETKNADFPVGTLVVCPGGWTTHSLCKGENESKLPPYPEGVPLSLALGTLGMPGMTAHYGLLEICAPKPGEVVVVSGAAGAVGSVVGQIAKIKGCKVIGFAGSDEKVAWLKELGFDEAFNYKTIKNLDATLKSVAPDGINCYFDNVGGEFASTVVTNMAKYGRISCCGAISQYNDTAPQKLPPVFGTLVFMEIKMEGFIITTHIKHWPEWTKQHIQWIKEGKLKYKEHVTQGFDNMFDAFLGLFSGANTGKAIVKV